MGARRQRLLLAPMEGDLDKLAAAAGDGVAFLDQQAQLEQQLRYIKGELDTAGSGMRPLLRTMIASMTKKRIDDSKLPMRAETALNTATILVGAVEATQVKACRGGAE